MLVNNCELLVTNIKISVKLPTSISLDSLEERCQKIARSAIIFCNRKKKNILTIRYNNFTFIFFKRSSKISSPPQHCNITKLKSEEDILKAIETLFFIVDISPILLDYTIDNYSCCGNIFKSVDIEKFYLQEQNISCSYNEDNFPVVTVYCPQDLTSSSSPNQCSHIFRSGKLVMVGGRSLTDVRELFSYIVNILSPYLK